MIDFGIPDGDSSMSRTVGLPAAIAVKLVLTGKIDVTGVHIPVIPEIYEPILAELEGMGIHFSEEWGRPNRRSTGGCTLGGEPVRGSDLIVEMLVAYGVEYVFGVPGDTSIRLYDSLYARRDVITHVMARDERSAAFMADAYARLSGRPSVCESPSGAGALYTVPGVAEANASSVPVIALTSGIDLASEYKGVITELDHHMLYKTITKWSTFMKRYDKIPDTLRRAFRVATTGRPGAVHIAFPQEVLNAEIPGGEEDIYAEDACRFYPTFRVRCEQSEVDRAAELLVAAERPVIVAGGGAINARAWHELTELAGLRTLPWVRASPGRAPSPRPTRSP